MRAAGKAGNGLSRKQKRALEAYLSKTKQRAGEAHQLGLPFVHMHVTWLRSRRGAKTCELYCTWGKKSAAGVSCMLCAPSVVFAGHMWSQKTHGHRGGFRQGVPCARQLE